MAFIIPADVPGPFTHKEAIIVISNDQKHDADGVAHFMSHAYPYLKMKYGIEAVEEFCDCSGFTDRPVIPSDTLLNNTHAQLL